LNETAGRKGGRQGTRRRRLPRAELLIPIAIVAAAVILAASEFMVAFELTPPGAEPLREVSGGDRHGYSLVILAFFAIAAMVLAIATGSRAAAYAVAALGGVALLIFLIVDLPDAGQVGTLEDLITARAEPQAGFWMQGLGALALAVAGAVFATFDPATLRGNGRGAERSAGAEAPAADAEDAAGTEPGAGRRVPDTPGPARSRPR
jgi:peptidoglycan/LPS O-acetylase OafA/YrhL